MNFDFLKGLKGLDIVYGPCTDAEELVKSKPYLSLTAARKSAELLAKFIYMAAHATALQELTFADILSDYQVRQFINNRNVMDAFHFIRKSGNKAVHGEQEVSTSTALAVLQNLHFVAGETAKDLDLIHAYPDFDENVGVYPDATFDDTIQIPRQVMQMFLDYIEEHEKDEEGHLVRFDLENWGHLQYTLHGVVNMHERIEFFHKPNYESTIEYLQKYVSFIDMMATERAERHLPSSSVNWVEAQIEISVNGIVEFVRGKYGDIQDILVNKLQHANNFSIDIKVDGNLRSFYEDPEDGSSMIDEESIWQGSGMYDHLESLKRRESFIYKAIIEYPDDDQEENYFLIRNGKDYDVVDLCNHDIVNTDCNDVWYGNLITLVVDYDNQLHPEIAQSLYETVRNFVSDNELTYLEDVWEDEEHQPGSLLAGTSIECTIAELQSFLDKINSTLQPVSEQCKGFIDHQASLYYDLTCDLADVHPRRRKYVEGLRSQGITVDPSIPELRHCFNLNEKFGVMAVVWKDHQFQLVGTFL